MTSKHHKHNIVLLNLDATRVCPLNIRKYSGRTVGTLALSIKERGEVLQPVRYRVVEDENDNIFYEIVAGQRRFLAVKQLQKEGVDIPLPGVRIEASDDEIILASADENYEREDIGLFDQQLVIKNLLKTGMTEAQVASKLDITTHDIRKSIALDKLTPKVKRAYEDGYVAVDAVRQLTMASPKQQNEILTKHLKQRKSAEGRRNAPLRSFHVKDALKIDNTIDLKHALFDVESSGLKTIEDLFDEQEVVVDVAEFWRLQNEAIEQRMQGYRDRGWSKVTLLSEYFYDYQYEKCKKKDGGQVFVEVYEWSGKVVFHAGYVKAKGYSARVAELEDKKPTPELSQTARDYLAQWRAECAGLYLMENPVDALRYMVFHLQEGAHSNAGHESTIEHSICIRPDIDDRDRLVPIKGRVRHSWTRIRNMPVPTLLKLLAKYVGQSITEMQCNPVSQERPSWRQNTRSSLILQQFAEAVAKRKFGDDQDQEKIRRGLCGEQFIRKVRNKDVLREMLRELVPEATDIPEKMTIKTLQNMVLAALDEEENRYWRPAYMTHFKKTGFTHAYLPAFKADDDDAGNEDQSEEE